jgi:hypothetical protein
MDRFTYAACWSWTACGATAGGTSQTTGRKPTLIIENVTVVPMNSDQTLPHHTVLDPAVTGSCVSPQPPKSRATLLA